MQHCKAIILSIKNFKKGSETGDKPNLPFEESKEKKKNKKKTIHTLLYFQCGLLYFKCCFESGLGWSKKRTNDHLPNQEQAIMLPPLYILRFLYVLCRLGSLFYFISLFYKSFYFPSCVLFDFINSLDTCRWFELILSIWKIFRKCWNGHGFNGDECQHRNQIHRLSEKPVHRQ